MSLWIISAILIAVPLVLAMRGADLLALSFGTALTYGLYVAAVFAAVMALPGPIGTSLFGLLTGSTSDFSDPTSSPFALVAIGRSTQLAVLLFAGLSLFLLVLRRWTNPKLSRATTALFWCLHLSFAGVFIVSAILSATAAPPTFEFSAPSSMSLFVPDVFAALTMAQFIFAVVLTLNIGWGIHKGRQADAL